MLEDLTTVSPLSQTLSLSPSSSPSYIDDGIPSASPHLHYTADASSEDNLDFLALNTTAFNSSPQCSGATQSPEGASVDSTDSDLSHSIRRLSLEESHSISTASVSKVDGTIHSPVVRDNGSTDQLSAASPTIPHRLLLLTDAQLKAELEQLGEHPGPITDTTRPVYRIYLTKLQCGGKPTAKIEQKGM